MNLTLQRNEYREDGIFGQLFHLDTPINYYTLERAYADETGKNFIPKVAVGTYKCVRHAPNRLPYETFMLQNVPDFQGEPVTGILIHILNFNKESEGCIGIGERIGSQANGEEMLINSKIAFEKFMDLQHNVNEFWLTIRNL
jgi:hypothetical protein